MVMCTDDAECCQNLAEVDNVPLVDGDIIQEGDQWYNFNHWYDGHIGNEGPWYTVKGDSEFIGVVYKPATMARMRRPTLKTRKN